VVNRVEEDWFLQNTKEVAAKGAQPMLTEGRLLAKLASKSRSS